MSPRVGVDRANQIRRLTFAAAGAAVLTIAALPWMSATYATTLAVEIMIAGIFASGINLLLGSTGLVSLGQGMFLGLGGYGVAIAASVPGLPLWLSVPATLLIVA